MVVVSKGGTPAERVRRIFAEQAGLELARVELSASLWADLTLDSLDEAEAVMRVEEEFAVVVSDEAAATWRTVADVLATVERLLPAEQTGSPAHEDLSPAYGQEPDVELSLVAQLHCSICRTVVDTLRCARREETGVVGAMLANFNEGFLRHVAERGCRNAAAEVGPWNEVLS